MIDIKVQFLLFLLLFASMGNVEHHEGLQDRAYLAQSGEPRLVEDARAEVII